MLEPELAELGWAWVCSWVFAALCHLPLCHTALGDFSCSYIHIFRFLLSHLTEHFKYLITYFISNSACVTLIGYVLPKYHSAAMLQHGSVLQTLPVTLAVSGYQDLNLPSTADTGVN